MGDATWRHLHGIESRSDERRRGYTWREGRRRHSHRTRKHRGLEGAHSHHGLLHGRNLETSQDKLTCCRIHQTAPVRDQRSGEGQQCWKVYLCERRSCCSHRHELLLVVLQRLRLAVLGQFLRRFKHLPCTGPLWEEQTITDQPQWPRCGRNDFIFVHQACILPLPGDKVSTSKIPPSLSSSS